jgi:predicted RNA-binding protein with PUA-like domain
VTPEQPRWGERWLLPFRKAATRVQSSAAAKPSFLIKLGSQGGSWDEMVRTDGITWTGNTLPTTLFAMRLMQADDEVLIFQEGRRAAIVGVARVADHPSANLASSEPRRLHVVLKPVRPIDPFVTLERIRHASGLEDFALVRSPNLSVVRVSPAQRAALARLGVA